MIPFQLMTSRVLKQIRRNEGVINYAVKANFLKRHFWRISIWKNQNSLRQFVMSEPYATDCQEVLRMGWKELHISGME